MRKSTSTLWILAALLVLLPMTLPAQVDDVVYAGIDVWTTSPFGTSQLDFRADPLPAGFFCPGSEPFDGVVPLEGAPLVTEPAGALNGADTVVLRLDDAPFDEAGVARTRIQLKALSMASVRPLQTRCGAFDVRVVLDGEQPTTEMVIRREHPRGGTFSAPLELRAKVLVTPVEHPDAKPLEILQEVALEPAKGSQWSFREPLVSASAASFVVADTDGDHEPDLTLPAASNFVASQAVGAGSGHEITATPCEVTTASTLIQSEGTRELAGAEQLATSTSECCIETCHCTRGSTDPLTPCANCEDGHLHCQIVKVPCDFEPNECATGPFCCPTTGTTAE